MSTDELNAQFDLLYSNNANVGPGLDAYDKSVFLTVAQDQVLNNYYTPKSNKNKEGFEGSEKRRRDLDALATSGISSSPTQTSANISPYSYFFSVEGEARYIINERVKVSSSETCLDNKILNVTPTSHDEYNIQKSNPFKRPDKENAWRLDFSNNLVEIIGASNYTPTEYHYRYIKSPSPIILEDLPAGLSIKGISVETQCELTPIAIDILNRAVELALEVSSNPRLKTKILMDSKDE